MPPHRHRRGLTLLELMLALSIMVFVFGTLAVLGNGVQTCFEYGEGYGSATQHARVVLDRMTRMVYEATANESFPGFVVLADQVTTWQFPDTLVVWHPSGPAANPQGLPLYKELVVYCPDPAAPNQLVEITAPTDSRTVPAITDATNWSLNVQAMKTSTASNKVILTNLLRTAIVPESPGSPPRGVMRFASRVLPSQSEWTQYTQGQLGWSQLSWAQGTYGAQTGLRQAWMRVEIQLLPSSDAAASNPAGRPAVPFFGSAALYYEIHHL